MLPQVNEYIKSLDYEYLIRRAFNYPYGHRLIGHWGNDTDKVRLKLGKALDKFIQNKAFNMVVKELMHLTTVLRDPIVDFAIPSSI